MTRASASCVALVLSLVLLAGCLGPAQEPAATDGPGPGPASDGAPGAGPDDRPGKAEGRSDDDLVPADLPGVQTLEGIECVQHSYSFTVTSEALEQRTPPQFQVGSTVTIYFLDAHHCRSVVLNDTALGKDVWFVLGYIYVDYSDQPENGTNPAFLLEPMTDWEPLHDAWTAQGVPSRMATFQESTLPFPGLTIEAADLTYQLQTLGPDLPEGTGGGRVAQVFSVDGTVIHEYVRTEHRAQVVLRAAVTVAEGGLLSELAPASALPTYISAAGPLTLSSIPDPRVERP